MPDTTDTIKSAALSALPPLGAAGVTSWPWWALAVLFVISCGPYWLVAWVDSVDYLRDRRGQ